MTDSNNNPQRINPAPTEMPENDKLSEFKTVADLINAEWDLPLDLPLNEPQQPTDAYIVDNAAVTIFPAITRTGTGAGQTHNEPIGDIWLQEKDPNKENSNE